jgi:crotonobetainyl-CoA:carnitine CoA-transferase CaiB-like acyl-CoA transferase
VVPPAKVLDAPQARSEQTLADFSFQGYEFEAPDFPLRQEFGQHGPASPPSLLGEHTREILHGLGYAPAECEALIAEGVIATPATDKPVWAPVARQKD